jgi:predicted PurR-regulated permease PerM
MKKIIFVLLFSIVLALIANNVNAQNTSNNSGKTLNNSKGINQMSKSSNASSTAAINNNNNSVITGNQTEQDKAVNNVSKATGQVAKQAGDILGNISNQVGKTLQNITDLGKSANKSSTK